MEQPESLLKNGTQVRVHDKIKDDFLLYGDRTPGAIGRIAGVVGGFGGDVYWVTHDSGTTAKYCFTEFELHETVQAGPIVGASESDFPYWFGEEDGGALGIIKRCVVYADGDAWLSDGRCAFLVRRGGLKTQAVKDFADVIRSSIQNATANVQEGHIMFEPDTNPNRLGYGARNFVIGFSNRVLRGLHVALVRRLYGEPRWAMDPNNERAPLIAWAGGRPVAIIMPIWSK